MFWDLNYIRHLRYEIDCLKSEKGSWKASAQTWEKELKDAQGTIVKLKRDLDEAIQAKADVVRLKEKAEAKLRDQTKADLVYACLKIIASLVSGVISQKEKLKTQDEFRRAMAQAQGNTGIQAQMGGIQPSVFDSLFGQPFWRK